MNRLIEILQRFWDKGVDRVSPGALGMVVQGMPYEKRQLEVVVAQTPGVRWDGDWMVKD